MTYKKILIVSAIIVVLFLGTLPFIQLLWNHPFLQGTADVITLTQCAKMTIDAQTITCQGSHGYYNALQLFPFLPLQGVAMTLMNTLSPLLNFWLMQHLLTFLNTSLFLILGRRLTGSTIGGILAALFSFFILDIPIVYNAGLARFLSTFQYSLLFFISILTFFPQQKNQLSQWNIRFLIFLIGSATLFSHHHFGMLRIVILLFSIVIIMLIFRFFSPKYPRTILNPSLQAILAVIAVWIISNISYLSFFFGDFIQIYL